MSDIETDSVMTQAQFGEVQQQMKDHFQQQIDLMQQQHHHQLSLLLERISEASAQQQRVEPINQQQPDDIKKQVQDIAKPIINTNTNTNKSEYGKAAVLATSSKFTGDSTSYPLWSKTMKTILSNVGLAD